MYEQAATAHCKALHVASTTGLKTDKSQACYASYFNYAATALCEQTSHAHRLALHALSIHAQTQPRGGQRTMSNAHCVASAPPSECPVTVMLPTESGYAASSLRTATCTWPCDCRHRAQLEVNS